MYKEICKCNLCGKNTEVKFILPPTEEEKLGWICEDCEKELSEKKDKTDLSPLRTALDRG